MSQDAHSTGALSLLSPALPPPNKLLKSPPSHRRSWALHWHTSVFPRSALPKTPSRWIPAAPLSRAVCVGRVYLPSHLSIHTMSDQPNAPALPTSAASFRLVQFLCSQHVLPLHLRREFLPCCWLQKALAREKEIECQSTKTTCGKELLSLFRRFHACYS